jgi:cytochrome c oxidase subunit 3
LASHGHAAHPRLQHHFPDLHTQKDASSFGMWVFIAQEVMFFGGLFGAYTVYRTLYPGAFSEAAHLLDWKLGAFNTAVLIGSSLTMALAVHAAALGARLKTVAYLLATLVLGGVFLGVKVVEYTDKYHHKLIPGHGFQQFGDAPRTGAEAAHAALAAADAPVGHADGSVGGVGGHRISAANKRPAEIYFSLYFAMTGLHALHMIIGVPIILFIAWQAWRGVYSAAYNTPVEMVGLYWHFVDIVWIFLFPLLYLIH